ncbi:uncharacterized mitochondrial protein-like protein [Tanacetum coccineum]
MMLSLHITLNSRHALEELTVTDRLQSKKDQPGLLETVRNYWSLLSPLIFLDHPKRPGIEDPVLPYNMVRNVLDMNAHFGDFNCALLEAGKSVWVMKFGSYYCLQGLQTTTTTATIPTPRKGIVITELGTSTTTTTIISSQPSQAKVQDKGNGIMVEPEEPLKKKDQLKLDEEMALNLQAKIDEEERLAREKDEANVALTDEWDDIQAKVDADYQLAQRLQAKEQEQFTTKQKATLFKELLEQRRKHFAAKRAEENMNKPPTKSQQKKTMITYRKNMEGWKHKDLKSKDFDSIKELCDKTFKRVNMFVDYRTDLVEGSSKRSRDELEQELMKVIPDEEEVAIDAIPLATKPPTIVDWKIHKEGKKNYYQIIRADGSLKMYLVFSYMLKSFDREDFETLWKLVKAKYGSTRPMEDLDLILWGDLKTMFEPHVEDRVWRNQ